MPDDDHRDEPDAAALETAVGIMSFGLGCSNTAAMNISTRYLQPSAGLRPITTNVVAIRPANHPGWQSSAKVGT